MDSTQQKPTASKTKPLKKQNKKNNPTKKRQNTFQRENMSLVATWEDDFDFDLWQKE